MKRIYLDKRRTSNMRPPRVMAEEVNKRRALNKRLGMQLEQCPFFIFC